MKKIAAATLTVILFALALLAGCAGQSYLVTKEQYDFLNSLTEEQYEIIKDLSPEDYAILDNMDLLIKAINYCEGNYYEDIDYSKADIAAAVAFVDSLDKYSYLALASSLVSSSTAGIGLRLEITEYNEYLITYVHPGTPAAAASEGGNYHLERGDKIYSVNGTRVQNASYSNFVTLSAGGVDTELTLTVDRGGVILDEEFVFVKADLTDVMTEAYYINDIPGMDASIGYIRLISFTETAAEDFTACIGQFLTDGNGYLILDLRGNTGGSSSIMSSIANYLVDDGTDSNSIPLISYTDKDGNSQTFNTTHNLYIDKPIAVLVNERSASASEALTSAMTYYGTAVTVGTTTYGKGTALNSPASMLDDDNALYYISILIGRYYVYSHDTTTYPEGMWCIEGIGLTPDYAVTDRTFAANLADDHDVVRAVEYFNIE